MSVNATLQHLFQGEPTASSITPPPAPAGDELRQAAGLLHRFNAPSLGEGNLMTGGNTLAAMAITVTNISPPGSCLVDVENDTSIPVGMSALVSGGLSCGVVSDRVLKALQELQENLFAHIRQQVERRKKSEKRISEAGMFLGKDEEPTPPTVLDRLGKNAYFNEAHFEEELRGLLRAPGNAGVSDITESPVIFAGIGSVEVLDNTTRFAHRGRLFAHVNLSGNSAGILLDQVCDEVVSGCPKRKQLAIALRGEVIATDPTGMLDTLLGMASGCGWLECMLWLMDHAAGPETKITANLKGSALLARPAECFEAALGEMAAKRLNFHKPEPVRLAYPLAGGQAEWNAFLARLEPSFPGITGALRPLLASLVFGLSRILNAAPVETRPRLVAGEVEAFARLLALRMVNARALALHHEDEQRVAKAASYIRMKLREGPHTVRDLMRLGHNLNAETCRDALGRLADAGVVEFVGKRWQLVVMNHRKPLTLHA